MRIDFPQGVPDGCTEWLDQHVGSGIYFRNSNSLEISSVNCAWFYERRFAPWDKQIKDWHNTQGDYVPSITVRDPAKAAWFALRWGV